MTATKRILLVDDDPAIVGVLSEMVTSLAPDYMIETAADGREALEAFMTRRPDLVLLDVHMPRVSGLELLKEIRRLDARVPVIMMTANKDVRLTAELLKSGAVANLPKPFDMRYIQHLLGMFLKDRQRGRR